MFGRILFASVLLATPALAQQQADPTASAYSALLNEANTRVVNLSAQNQKLREQVDSMQKELDALKPKPATEKPTK